MTVLVADSISSVGIYALEDAGHRVVSQAGLSGDALVDALATEQPDVLIVRSTKVQADALDASDALSLIVRAGAGYDTIDVAGASARGVFVANCPGKNSVAVAELTMGLIVALDRRIPDNVAEARGGHWNKKRYAKAEGLKGRTIGVVGLGNIGAEVVRRATAFDLDVIAWSRSLTPESAAEQGVGYRESPQAVAADASIVTLHVAATPDTRHLADRAFFEAMPDGALFVNTTRGSVVDESALAWAMDEKNVLAALDVFDGEPSYKEGDFEHPLMNHPNLYLTHHIGASTQQAQDATAAEAARVVTTFADSGTVPNCVNLEAQAKATHKLTVRHVDEIGALAKVLGTIQDAGWNVHEMDNRIFQGEKAAVASIRIDARGHFSAAKIDAIRDADVVLAVSYVDL